MTTPRTPLTRKRRATPRRATVARATGSAGRALRHQLATLLASRDAHLDFDDVIARFRPADRGRRPAGAPHSAWQLLEHLRICQWDILEFSRDPKHVSPSFPDGLWPTSARAPKPSEWNASVRAFQEDRAAMVALVLDSRRDLLAQIDHPEARPKHTLLREALVLADHNAYHIGQLAMLQRQLSAR